MLIDILLVAKSRSVERLCLIYITVHISCRKSFCQIRLYKEQCVLHKVKLQSLRNQLRFWIPNDVKINKASGLIDNHLFHQSAVVYYKMLIYHSKLCTPNKRTGREFFAKINKCTGPNKHT